MRIHIQAFARDLKIMRTRLVQWTYVARIRKFNTRIDRRSFLPHDLRPSAAKLNRIVTKRRVCATVQHFLGERLPIAFVCTIFHAL